MGKTDSRIARGEAKFKAAVEARGGTVLSPYMGMVGAKVLLRCGCGHEWQVLPANVVHNGTWCPKCGHAKRKVKRPRRKMTEKTASTMVDPRRFRAIVAAKGGTVVGEYVNNKTKVRLRCGHGHEWDALPNNVVSGRWCPVCWRQQGKKNGNSPPKIECDDKSLTTAAIAVTMSLVGIDRIDDSNLKQACCRISIWQRVAGPAVISGKAVMLDVRDIKRNVGIVLPGIGTLSSEEFELKLGEIATDF